MPKTAGGIKELITGLRSPKKRVRYAAFDALQALTKKGVSAVDGERLLRAAAESFPPPRYDFQSTACDLIRAAATRPVAAYVPIIRRIFGRLRGSAAFGLSDPRGEALGLLTAVPHVSAARAFVELWEAALSLPKPPRVGFVALQRSPMYPKVYFPRLFGLAATHEAIAFDVFSLALAFAEKGALSPADLAPHADFVIDAFRRLGPLPGAAIGAGLGRAWLWDDAYSPTRSSAALLLDLMGHIASREVEPVLRRAIKSADPRLALFAATSLLRRGKRVTSDDLDRIATDPSTRAILFDALARDGKQERFPKRWATQEALAEADMVQWLTFPSELGRAPDEIELMHVAEVDVGPPNGVLRWFVFRFRTGAPHWSANDGWLAGVSGPFKKGTLSAHSFGDTFSEFASWESRTPDEHVEEIHELMETWRERAL